MTSQSAESMIGLTIKMLSNFVKLRDKHDVFSGTEDSSDDSNLTNDDNSSSDEDTTRI